jgi:urea transporter
MSAVPFFTNNPLSGLLVLAGILMHSRVSGLLAVVGLISATATAYFLSVPPQQLRNGVYGYLGVMLGTGYPIFHSVSDLSRDVLCVTFLGSLSAIMMKTLCAVTVPRIGMGPLGSTFVVTQYTWIAMCAVMHVVSLDGPYYTPRALPPYEGIEIVALTRATLVTIGSLMFCKSAVSGLVFAVAVGVSSPISLAFLVGGTAMGLLFYPLFAIHHGVFHTGLLAANGSLVCMALGGYLLRLRGYAIYAYVTLGNLLSFLLSLLMWKALPFGYPFFGLPYTLVVWVLVVCVRRGWVVGVEPTEGEITVPEEHMRTTAAEKAKKKD